MNRALLASLFLFHAFCLASSGEELTLDATSEPQATTQMLDQEGSGEFNEGIDEIDVQAPSFSRCWPFACFFVCTLLVVSHFACKSQDSYNALYKYLLSFRTNPWPGYSACELDRRIYYGDKIFQLDSGFRYEYDLENDKEYILRNENKVELNKEKLCNLFGCKRSETLLEKNSLGVLIYLIYFVISHFSMRLFYFGLPKPSSTELAKSYGVENVLFDVYSCVSSTNLSDSDKKKEIIKFVGLFYWCNKVKIEEHACS